MICQTTAKTEAVFAVAGNCGDDLVKILLLDTTLYSIRTIWGWAPLQLVLIFNVRPSEKLVVSVLQL